MSRDRIGRVRNLVVAGAISAAIGALLTSAAVPVAGQDAQRAYRAPRTSYGVPDFNGIWQTNNTANWNIQDHDQKQGPVWQLGAAFSVPAGEGVVVGNEIPYKPEALAKKKENEANWMKEDPEVKCYLPGLPRATYMPYPFQIVQTPATIVFAYAYANASRIVYMNTKVPAQIDTWMGYSSGRFEGETLVIDTNGFNDLSWFDRAGNWHSEELKITERYTMTSPDAIKYDVTLEDPKVFTRPWQMTMPIYRRLEKPGRLLKYHCVEFSEDMLYNHLRREPRK